VATLVATAPLVVAGQSPAAPAPQQAADSALTRVLENARAELVGLAVPPALAFAVGDRTIAAGSTVAGPVAVVGTLRVAGLIEGDAFAHEGDIVVLEGGRISGSAVALEGRVRLEGGAVDGESRSIAGAAGGAPVELPSSGTGHNVALTLGWATVVLLVGIGVLVFGGRTLDAVGDAVEQQFGRSFVVGIGATIGIAPVLALLIIGLALTILGILLIPFAIVAYVLAVIGLVTLGFLATARLAGNSLSRDRRGRSHDERAAALRALMLGIAFFLGLWLIAAVLTPIPTAATVARVIAFAITWAAATVGLGATIITRAGSRPAVRDSAPMAVSHAEPAVATSHAAMPVATWETPTPVSGVVAARRPTSTRRP
jgi:hypothetical protein